MNKQHIIFSLIAVSLFGICHLAFGIPRVYADMCTTQYGGSQTCQASDLTINKQVLMPTVTPSTTHLPKGVTPTPTPMPLYVENLTTSDPTFSPGSEIDYRLIITNSSGETFNPVNVKDTLPPYVVTFLGGKPGTFNYDSTSHILTFQLANLIAGETRTFDLRFRIADASQFPAGKSLFCVTNVAEVSAINRFDSDSAQACLQNGNVTQVTTLPVAGFNDFVLLLPFAGVALSGFAILKGKKRG